MTIRGIADIQTHFAQGNFEYLKDHHASHWFGCDNFEEHHEMIIRLRAEGVITDSDIYLNFINIQDAPELDEQLNGGKLGKVFTLLNQFPRDGSLVIENSEHIWRLANDYSLPLIAAFIESGVQLDHNALLATTFAGEHDTEFKLFTLLISQFPDFSQQALSATCATVLCCLQHNPEETQYIAVIQTLLEHGANLNTCFNNDTNWSSWHTDYRSLFGAFLQCNPALLLALPEIAKDYIPTPELLSAIDWNFLVCEGEFEQAHADTITALTARGAVFPVADIIEALEENGYHRYVAELNAYEK